jgi:hypothetical protein
MERKSIRLAEFILVIFGVFLSSQTEICFAETHSQKDALFTIDVPTGWGWSENAKTIVLTNPQKDNAISISFSPKVASSQGENKVFLEQNSQDALQSILGNYKPSQMEKKDILINDNYAILLEACLKEERSVSVISTLKKGYWFVIVFSSRDKEENKLLNNIIKTFKF